jgi:hypothetical protein
LRRDSARDDALRTGGCRRGFVGAGRSAGYFPVATDGGPSSWSKAFVEPVAKMNLVTVDGNDSRAAAPSHERCARRGTGWAHPDVRRGRRGRSYRENPPIASPRSSAATQTAATPPLRRGQRRSHVATSAASSASSRTRAPRD